MISSHHRTTEATTMTAVSTNMQAVKVVLIKLAGEGKPVEKRGMLMMPAAIVVTKIQQRGIKVHNA